MIEYVDASNIWLTPKADGTISIVMPSIEYEHGLWFNWITDSDIDGGELQDFSVITVTTMD